MSYRGKAFSRRTSGIQEKRSCPREPMGFAKFQHDRAKEKANIQTNDKKIHNQTQEL